MLKRFRKMTNQETQILGMIGDMKGELGEFRGQLRELIHNMNNVSVKLDAFAATTARNHDLPNQIADLKARVAILEACENKRVGAMGLGHFIFKSPFLGWVFACATAAWAFLHSKG